MFQKGFFLFFILFFRTFQVVYGGVSIIQSNGLGGYNVSNPDGSLTTIQSNGLGGYIIFTPETHKTNTISYNSSKYDQYVRDKMRNRNYFSGGEFIYRRFKMYSKNCNSIYLKDVSSNECYCSTGYFRDIKKLECLPIPCPDINSSFKDNNGYGYCACNLGYSYNKKNNVCEKSTTENTCVDRNSHLSTGGICTCNEKYLFYPKENKCVKVDIGCQITYGENSYATGEKGEFCDCKNGYARNTTKTTCNKIIISNLKKNSKACIKGWTRSIKTGKCIKTTKK